jgi:hypothetical protein
MDLGSNPDFGIYHLCDLWKTGNLGDMAIIQNFPNYVSSWCPWYLINFFTVTLDLKELAFHLLRSKDQTWGVAQV